MAGVNSLGKENGPMWETSANITLPLHCYLLAQTRTLVLGVMLGSMISNTLLNATVGLQYL